MLRLETKTRARALQLLYAWELRGRAPIPFVTPEPAMWNARPVRELEAAEALAESVAADAPRLDGEIGRAADNWRFERIGVIERNILRLALHELEEGDVPAKVAINEAVRLAQWFAGPRAPAFVNGVLDGIARQRGLL